MATTINWRPFVPHSRDGNECGQAWDLACDWLVDYGIDIDGASEPPDAMAEVSATPTTYAFRLDYTHELVTKSIVAEVEIDEDPPAHAVRVTITRGGR